MADLKAQLEISADASGVETGVGKAKRSLADLGVTAQAAGKQAAEGLDKVGAGAAPASAKVDRATQNIIGSIQRTTAALESGGKASSSYFATLAQQRGIDPTALKPYLDQLDQAATKAKAAEAALKGTPAQLERVGMSARATAAALRGVPAQFTDIVTSLQGGQRPLTVFLQQGGQLKDMFGGAAPAARALGGYIAGLINPYTLAAAAAGALGYALLKGNEEATAYSTALILSGNAAGTTTGQMNEMAKAISRIAGTQGNAADAVAQFAASGAVARSNLEQAALAAVKFERATGQAVSETVKQFVELGKAPLEASQKLNESQRYLTMSTYAQIKALEEQGKQTQAAALAQKTYADAIDSRSDEIVRRLGLIERAWKGIKDATKGAFDAALSVGRQDTLQDELGKAQKKLADLEARGALGARGGRRQSTTNVEIEQEKQRIANINEMIRLDNRQAESSKRASDQLAARIQFDKDGAQFATNAAKMEREITKARNEGAAAGASQAEIEKRISDIRKKFEDKGAARSALAIDKSQLAADLADITQAQARLIGIYNSAERQIEALRAAGTLTDREYYESKRALINLEGAAVDDALTKEKARLQQEKLTGKDRIDNNRKIAEVESKIAIVRADSSAKLEILTIQEEAAAKRRALAFLSARQAAQDYFDAIDRQQQRDLSGFGQGTQRRELNAGLSQIEDRFAGQRRDLENQRAQLELEGKFTDDSRQQYEERLRIINEFQSKSIDSYTAYYERLKILQGDATLGAKEALQNYFDESQKLGKQTEDVVGKALNGIEDYLVKLSTTGKASFKDLANSIIADLIRIEYRRALGAAVGQATGQGSGSGQSIWGALLSAAGSYFGSDTTQLPTGDFSRMDRGQRATGGPVSAGGLYRINERGPGEILESGDRQYLMAGRDGTVKAATTGGGERPVTVNINQSFAPGTTRQTTDQAAVAAGRSVARATSRGNA